MSNQPPWDPGSGEPVDPSRQPPPAGFPPPGSTPPPSGYPPPVGTPPGQPQPGYNPPPGSGFNPPPGQAPPYNPGYGAPATPKKRRVWVWLLGIFGFLALGIGGCSFLLFRAVSGPIDHANEFLAAIDAADYSTAASMVSHDPGCFGENAQQDLSDYFGGVALTDYDLKSVNVSSTNGESTGDVSGTIEVEGQPKTTIKMGLVKEGGDWKLCGLVIDS